MKMRMKENVELGIRENYLGVHGSITLKAGDVFEVTKNVRRLQAGTGRDAYLCGRRVRSDLSGRNRNRIAGW